MLKNNALAQALFLITILNVSSVFSMKKEQSIEHNKQYPSKYICQQAFIEIAAPLNNKIISSILKIKSPQLHWNTQQRKDYLNTYRSQALGFLDKSLTAYRLHQNQRANNQKATLLPQSIYFYPDSSKIKVTSREHRCNVPSVGEVCIKLSSKAYVNTTTMVMTPEEPIVQVSCNDKIITIEMAKLYKMYPCKGTLNLRPDTQKTVYERTIKLTLSCQLRQSGILNTAVDIMDPDDYLNQLQQEDLQNMVTYYLLNHDVEL